MSLDDRDRALTAAALDADRKTAGLTIEETARLMGWTPYRTWNSLTMSAAADPADVWRLRDRLHQAVLEVGGTPAEHPVLTEKARAAARLWFGI
jgi:hypothetical protein